MSVPSSLRAIRYKTAARRLRRQAGGAVAEAVGSLAVLLPLILLVLFVVLEISEYFVLKQGMAYVSREAAKELANAMGVGEASTDASLTGMNAAYPNAGSGSASNANYSQILNNVAVPGIINANSANQFQVQWTANNPNPQYVLVSVSYANGNNLPVFPWNPIGSGGSAFQLGAGLLNSACTWPIPH